MSHLGTWFNDGFCSAGLMVKLNDLRGLFYLKWCYDCTLWNSVLVCCILILICICSEQKKSLPNLVVYSKGYHNQIKKNNKKKKGVSESWKEVRYKPLCFSTLFDCCLKGDQEDVNIESFWCFHSECWNEGILPHVPETSSYSLILYSKETPSC